MRTSLEEMALESAFHGAFTLWFRFPTVMGLLLEVEFIELRVDDCAAVAVLLVIEVEILVISGSEVEFLCFSDLSGDGFIEGLLGDFHRFLGDFLLLVG